MLQVLLLVGCSWGCDCGSGSPIRSATSFATVARPQWIHATPFTADPRQDAALWPTPDATAIVDDIPPSPQILNSAGGNNAFSALFDGAFVGSVDNRNDPRDLSLVTDDVAELLERWEKATPEVPREIKFRRTIYDLTSAKEMRATGSLRYLGADRGEVHFQNDRSEAWRKSDRTDWRGRPFRVCEGVSERWIWSDEGFLHIELNRNTTTVCSPANVSPNNPQDEFIGSMRLYAPFAIDIRAESIRREWDVKLLTKDTTSFILEARPRTARHKRQFDRCLIRIDSRSSQLTAIKYIDPSRRCETLYIVESNCELKSD